MEDWWVCEDPSECFTSIDEAVSRYRDIRKGILSGNYSTDGLTSYIDSNFEKDDLGDLSAGWSITVSKDAKVILHEHISFAIDSAEIGVSLDFELIRDHLSSEEANLFDFAIK